MQCLVLGDFKDSGRKVGWDYVGGYSNNCSPHRSQIFQYPESHVMHHACCIVNIPISRRLRGEVDDSESSLAAVSRSPQIAKCMHAHQQYP